MPSSLISLGANLGNTLETMRAASRLLEETFVASEIRLSSILKTPPVGGPSGQGDFLNAIARIDHPLNVWEVWERIKKIETELGRQRFRRWESRRIDIDLILHDQDLVWTPHLKVPHPRMSMRTFVMRPACQVASDWIDPVTQWSIRELTERLDSPREPRIAVACSNESLQRQLQAALERQGLWPSSSTRIETKKQPSDWWQVWPEADLHIACIDVPDPENVQWEDYALPWALAMGIAKPTATIGSHQGTLPKEKHGLRYLLPGSDVDWICHEIQAARLALRCPVEDSGESWTH
jgi:2-amino-4-hydroxy-6-hydroxymethyldihydropteridine diphosphokinase